MTLPAPAYPRPPAEVAPYVEALGFDLAIDFLLRFGGAEMSLSESPKGASEAEALCGPERMQALASVRDRLPKRVPLAKRWLAQCLAARGQSVGKIARTLRTTDVSVRRMLAPVEPDRKRGYLAE